MSSSFSANSLATTSTTTPVNIPIPAAISTNQTPNSATTPGSSSPAFKSLFRNLRVGSFKHQPTSPSLAESSTNRQLNLTPTTINEDDTTSTKHSQKSPVVSQPLPISLSRTASSTSTSTFKPASSITTPNSDIKHDYSNCISQLQSAAAQAMVHISHSNSTASTNFSSFSGSLSPPANAPIAAAPILLRGSKLNQSQNSIHSSIASQNSHALSTFKDSNSSSANLNHSDSKKRNFYFRLKLCHS